MKLRTIVVGIGQIFFRDKTLIEKKYDIVALVDGDITKQGIYQDDKLIISYDDISGIEYDLVLVVPLMYAIEISNKLLDMGVDEKKIEFWCPELQTGLYKNYMITTIGQSQLQVVCRGGNLSDIKFCAFYKENLFNMQEVFFNAQYDFGILNNKCIVIDVGMNIGLSSLYFANRADVDCVYSFEPFLTTFRRAIQNFALNDVSITKKITAYNFGLSDSEGEYNFPYSEEHSLMNRTDLQNNSNANEHIINQKVNMKNAGMIIDSIVKKYPNSMFLVKIDTEGAETRILNSMEHNRCIEDIHFFLIETHLHQENIIKSILNKHKFKYFSNYNYISETGMLYAYREPI